jgi:diguanylate cyclase (GGDEF)-like protein
MSKPIPTRLLLIEDNPGDARLLREMLRDQTSHATTMTRVATMTEAEAHLAAHRVDLILLDLGLPDAKGLGAVRQAHAVAPRIPLVVLTGLDDESLALHALQEGAQDYLIKGEIDPRGLMRALRYAIERKVLEDTAREMTLQIAHSAQHDVLTGLPNRMLLNDRITQAIALAPRHLKQVAVLFLDIDGFKHINDSLGHPIGDRLLQSVATRLVDCVRASDTVSRQGGDEFIVLLSEAEQWEDAAMLAKKMLLAVAEAHTVDLHDLHVTMSIGVSIYPDDGADAETLIKNADTAMYQAKENGRQGYQFFRKAMNVRAVERQSIEESLRQALDRQEFVLHYQPKVDLRTGTITGAEALIRWMHPTRGLIPPDQFISIAEDSGLIRPIGAWALREACRQARSWQDARLPVTTAVNVSAIQLRDEGFLAGLWAILGESGLDPGSLELELTESVLMKEAEAAAAILRGVRERGVQVALDDFGTGYSSLSYLRHFPIDMLKIDQSFVRQITSASGDDTSIVTAVIGMAHSLNLRVIAEGVETSEQLAFLRAHDCDEAQGFLFCPPVPAEEFAGMLTRGIQPARIAV